MPPQAVVRHDDDDPYLVVAADKGTATFSDIANGDRRGIRLLARRRVRLGRLEPATTTRRSASPRAAPGSWSSAISASSARDIQATDFTVVGVGDMAGDVFGNGMLQSRHIRLVGRVQPPAHLHRSRPRPGDELRRAQAAVRQLPRSSWADYDKALISPGGGVFERSAKFDPDQPRDAARLRHRRRPSDPGRADPPSADGRNRPAVLRRHRHLCQGARREPRRGRRPRQRRAAHRRRGDPRQGGRRGRQSRRDATRPHRLCAERAAASTPTRSTTRPASRCRTTRSTSRSCFGARSPPGRSDGRSASRCWRR